MSITKYFTAEPIKSLMTKSSQYADPAFGIFRISNNHPCQPSNHPPKPGQGQLVTIPVTNPTNRVSRHRREGGAEPKQSTESAKKKKGRAFTGDSAHPLIMLMRLEKHFHLEPLLMILMMTYLQIIHKLHVMQKKARERKNSL